MSEADATRIGAIDIGTVTTRLLVADVSARGITEVERSTDITHLGTGLTVSGRLGSDAMERVVSCITRYRRMMDDLGVQAYEAVATSASRDAENGAEFLDRLEAAGVRPSIIPGEREAQLSFAGATFGLSGSDVLVNDIGGGSTEIVVGDPVTAANSAPRIDIARSIDVGSRRVTERFLHDDPPTKLELADARAFIAQEFGDVADGLGTRPTRCISLAGTATTLSAISQGMTLYDPARIHGSRLTYAELRRITDMLACLPTHERRGVPGLHPDRASVIVAGALVLEVLLESFGLEVTEVSEHDLLYGILLDTFGKAFA